MHYLFSHYIWYIGWYDVIINNFWYIGWYDVIVLPQYDVKWPFKEGDAAVLSLLKPGAGLYSLNK